MIARHRLALALTAALLVGCGGAERETVAVGAPAPTYAAETVEGTPIGIDAPSEAARLRPFVTELGASYPLWHDPDDRVSSTFLALGVPASYLIDRDGVLRWRHMGPVRADDPALTAALRTVLTSAP